MEEEPKIDFKQIINNASEVVDGSYDGRNWISDVLSSAEIDRLRAALREHSRDTITPEIAKNIGLGSKQNEVARLLGKLRL